MIAEEFEQPPVKQDRKEIQSKFRINNLAYNSRRGTSLDYIGSDGGADNYYTNTGGEPETNSQGINPFETIMNVSNNSDLPLSQATSLVLGESEKGFGKGLGDGFIAGAKDTWGLIKSLRTKEGWVDLGKGMLHSLDIGVCHTCPGEPVTPSFAARRGEKTLNYISNIPNMSSYEIGYGLGYGSEKLVEGILLTKGVGTASNLRFMSKFNWAGGNIKFQFGLRNIKNNYHLRLERHRIGGSFKTHINYGIGGKNHFPNY